MDKGTNRIVGLVFIIFLAIGLMSCGSTGSGGGGESTNQDTQNSQDTTAPTNPMNLDGVAASSSQINLTWYASSDNKGVTGYDIYRGTDKIGTSGTADFNDAGLTPDTNYCYTVKAFDAAGNISAPSGQKCVTTVPMSLDDLAAMVKKIDVSGAHGFMLTGNGGTAATSAKTAMTALAKAADDGITLEENSIYKVTDDGRLERVPVTDDVGNEIPRGAVRPIDLRDLDSLYVVFWFQIDQIRNGYVYSSNLVPYLVHKPSGLAYRASEVIPNNKNNFYYERDVAGNLYISNGNNYDSSKLLRIDGSGLGSGALTARELKTPDLVASWTIDANGTFLAYLGYASKDVYDDKVTRFLDIESGSLTNLGPLGAPPPKYNEGDYNWFRGTNGKAYFIIMNDDIGLYTQMCRDVGGNRNIGCSFTIVSVERGSDGSPVVTQIGSPRVTKVSDGLYYSSPYGTRSVWPCPGSQRYAIGGREIILNGSYPGGQLTYYYNTLEVFPDQAKVVVHDIAENELSKVKDVRVSGNFIFYFGTSKTTFSDVILRYDPVSLTATTFDLGADYDINRFKVLNSDTVWFEALRLSDQATVIGKMAGDGTVTIADVVAADEPQIIVMEAIHPTDFLVINGDMQEWSPDKRTQEDVTGDAVAGDDLHYYSEQKSKTNYFGLVEYGGNEVSSKGITRVTIDNTYQIRIGSASSEFRDLISGTSDMLRNIGGIAAQGVAVEFSVPITALSMATLTDVKVVRIKEELFGDVSTIIPLKDGNVSTITPVKNGNNWELTIGMATPLGNATVDIALTGSYVLRFDKAGAMIDDSKTQKDITSLGGSISYPDPDSSDVMVVIPAAAIGSPAGLSPTDWQSSGGDWTLTIVMATSLGDATVELGLAGNYLLRLDKIGAVIDDGLAQSDLTDVGGSIVYPVTDGGDITVVIPGAAIASPASLSPTEQSGGQLFDVVIDVMGN